MFGNLGEMAGMLKKAKELQANIKNLKEEMANSSFEGISGGGKVKVVCSGDLRIISIQVSPAIATDAGMVEDLMLVAVNAALSNAKMTMQQKMSEASGGLNLPELF